MKSQTHKYLIIILLSIFSGYSDNCNAVITDIGTGNSTTVTPSYISAIVVLAYLMIITLARSILRDNASIN